MDREALFRKIRGLLNQVEGTDNEHEKMAFLAKAQELMTIHAIDEEVLWASDPSREPPKPIEIKVKITDKTGKAWLRHLVHHCAINNRCDTYYYDGEAGIQVVGFQDDVLFVEMLYTSLKAHLDLQLAIGLAVHSREENSRTFRNNFIRAFVRTVANRMAESRRQFAKAEHSTGVSTELVLAGREARVKAYMSNLDLREVTVKASGAYSRGATALGAEAGRTADISGGRRNLDKGRRALPSG